jgi:hypothetical protein
MHCPPNLVFGLYYAGFIDNIGDDDGSRCAVGYTDWHRLLNAYAGTLAE